MFICPRCGQGISTKRGLTFHERVCAKLPDDRELQRLWDQGATVTDLSRRFGVSRPVMRQRLMRAESYDHRGEFRTTRDNGREPLEELRVLAASEYDSEDGCRNCRGYDACRETVAQYCWMLCEAPDKGHAASLAADGVDLGEVVTWAREAINERRKEIRV